MRLTAKRIGILVAAVEAARAPMRGAFWDHKVNGGRAEDGAHVLDALICAGNSPATCDVCELVEAAEREADATLDLCRAAIEVRDLETARDRADVVFRARVRASSETKAAADLRRAITEAMSNNDGDEP